MTPRHNRIRTASTLLVLAVVLVFTVGKAYFSVPGLWEANAHQIREVRLIPFETFRTARVWWGPWLNFFGNIALFIPVGWVFYRGDLRRAVLMGLGLSVGIEVAQFVLAAGFSDLDDVAFNTLGAALGARLAERLGPTGWGATSRGRSTKASG